MNKIFQITEQQYNNKIDKLINLFGGNGSAFNVISDDGITLYPFGIVAKENATTQELNNIDLLIQGNGLLNLEADNVNGTVTLTNNIIANCYLWVNTNDGTGFYLQPTQENFTLGDLVLTGLSNSGFEYMIAAVNPDNLNNAIVRFIKT